MTPPSAAAALLFLLISGVSFVQPVHSESSQQPMCLRESAAFVCSLNHKCPFSISPNPLIQVRSLRYEDFQKAMAVIRPSLQKSKWEDLEQWNREFSSN